MGKGRRKENEIVNEVWALTDGVVKAWPMGYSGNNAVPSGDIISIGPDGTRVTELKVSADERVYIGFDQLEQLATLAESSVTPQVLISFAHREPILMPFPAAARETWTDAVPHGVTAATTDGALRIDKPTLDAWSSQQAGKSAAAVIVDSHTDAVVTTG